MFALDQSSDARVDGRPFHVPVLQAEQPQLTVSDTELDSLLEHVACFEAVREFYPDGSLGVSSWLPSARTSGWVARCQTADALWLQVVPIRLAEMERDAEEALAVRNRRAQSLTSLPSARFHRNPRSGIPQRKHQLRIVGMTSGNLSV